MDGSLTIIRYALGVGGPDLEILYLCTKELDKTVRTNVAVVCCSCVACCLCPVIAGGMLTSYTEGQPAVRAAKDSAVAPMLLASCTSSRAAAFARQRDVHAKLFTGRLTA